jgi:hypothetical protein
MSQWLIITLKSDLHPIKSPSSTRFNCCLYSARTHVQGSVVSTNTTLTSLYLYGNDIQKEGEAYIAKALIYNPTLIYLNINYDENNCLYDKFKTTFHHLQGILNILIGEDGAKVLGMAFQIKAHGIELVEEQHFDGYAYLIQVMKAIT